jgi:uncharacterized protein
MRAILYAMGLCAFLISTGFAAAERKSQETVIGLLAAEPQWLTAASKLATRLDHENGIRIVPMLGAGGLRALNDLENLPVVDAAIVTSDALIYAAQQDILNGQQTKFSYIARLSAVDVVLIARRDIANVKDLGGKRIATGPAQSAAFATGELIFNSFDIQFTRVAKQDEAAIDALNNGEADAALILGTDISTAALSDGRFHVLKLQIPPQLAKIYQPAILTSRELPGLVMGKQSVETVATSLTLAVFDRPNDLNQSKSLQNFTSMMFKLSAGDSGSNLAAAVPGWKRHAESQKVLDQAQAATMNNATITPTGSKP